MNTVTRTPGPLYTWADALFSWNDAGEATKTWASSTYNDAWDVDVQESLMLRAVRSALGKTTHFDGTDVVTVADNALLQFGALDSFSVEFRIDFDPVPVNPQWSLGKGNGYSNVENDGGGPYTGGFGVAHWTETDPVAPAFYVTDGVHARRFVTGASMRRNVKTHYLFVVDRDAQLLRAYTNGVAGATTDISTIGSVAAIGQALLVGGMSGSRHQGTYDNLRIYSRVLSAAEAIDHANGVYADESGLVLHLPMNEVAGNTCYDLSGNALHGTVTGATRVTGINAGGARFKSLTYDGINAQGAGVVGPYSSFTASFSVEAWINTTDAGGQRCIASIAGGGEGWRFGFGSGKPYYLVGRGDGTAHQEGNIGTTTLNDGRWHHLCILYRLGTNVEAFIDGVSVGTVALAAGITDTNAGSVLWLGSMGGGLNGRYAGTSRGVRIYDRVLSATEIAEHAKGVFQDESGLVGWWEGVEQDGTTVYDFSGNAKHVTLNASVVRSTDGQGDNGMMMDLTKAVSESFSVAEALAKHFTQAIAETLALAENFNSTDGFNLRFNEALNFSEAIAKHFDIAKSETLDFVEALTKDLGLNKDEAVAFAEAFSRSVAFNLAIAETVHFAEAIGKAIGLSKTETIAFLDELRKRPLAVISDMLTGTGDMTLAEFQAMIENGRAPGFDDFRPFLAGDYDYQRAIFRAILESSTADRAVLQDLKLVVDVPDVQETGSATITNAATGVTVNFTRTFHIPPDVQLTLKGSTVLAIPRIEGAVTKTGFTAKLIDPSTGNELTGSFTWAADGY